MILKYKYHSDSGLLEAYRSYTLAQNNSLSDTIVITSTASDAKRYNYCLEFICYNSKSIPKAQYVSPILNYGEEGISFAVPNNLTEFRGHVDMQLTGYDPDDNSIVFKSISKNCKAFDIEGSLCVLEKDLNDTPNVFTEVLKQLEDLKNIHQDIVEEAMDRFFEQVLKRVAEYRWCNVKFYNDGILIDERWVTAGSKLTPPPYTLPDNCVIVGGWYNPATQTLWDTDNDTVQGSMKLYLNFMTNDVIINEGVVYSFGGHTQAHIYVPEYYEGYAVSEVYDGSCNVPYQAHLHFGNSMQYFESILSHQNVYGICFPSDNEYFISQNGYLYLKEDETKVLYFAPKTFNANSTVGIADDCFAINTHAVNGIGAMSKLIIPSSVRYLPEQCIENNANIKELRLPSDIQYIGEYAVYNNSKLKDIVLEGDCSDALGDDCFVNVDKNGVVTRPKLWVYPQHYEKYKARNLAYEIGVIGQDYLDGRYAQKEN